MLGACSKFENDLEFSTEQTSATYNYNYDYYTEPTTVFDYNNLSSGTESGSVVENEEILSHIIEMTTKPLIKPTTTVRQTSTQTKPTTTVKQTQQQTKPPSTTKTTTIKQTTIHTHNFSAATCNTPMTCRSCGVTQGNALGHNFANATCTTPKKCMICGLTEGDKLGHNFSQATCTSSGRCSRCNVSSGSALGHSYTNGKCVRCGNNDPDYVKTYGVGETWVVDGMWEITINSATNHYLCNSYANEKYGYFDQQVVVVNYTYKNLGLEDGLYLSDVQMDFYDGELETVTVYPCTHKIYPEKCIIGARHTATYVMLLKNDSDRITVGIELFDNKPQKHKAKFIIPIT